MRNFIKANKKHADCAIVGTYNAKVWLNGRASYRKIESLAKKKYSYTSQEGLSNTFVQDFWKDLGINTVNFHGLTVQYAEKEILNGRAAFASVRYVNDEDSHIVFLVPKDRTIEVINFNCTWIELVEKFLKGEVKLSIWMVNP